MNPLLTLHCTTWNMHRIIPAVVAGIARKICYLMYTSLREQLRQGSLFLFLAQLGVKKIVTRQRQLSHFFHISCVFGG